MKAHRDNDMATTSSKSRKVPGRSAPRENRRCEKQSKLRWISLTIKQILAWADAHHARTGVWPRIKSGTIRGTHGETWQKIGIALTHGCRGLRGGTSLARLLAKHRGVRNQRGQPRLTITQILRWADAHRKRTGQWPTRKSGPIVGTRYERWDNVLIMLRAGCRGLPRTTLRRLLIKYRGKQGRWQRPLLMVRQILGWADAHYQRTGNWPTISAGRVAEAPDETWKYIDGALGAGRRGLPGGTSLRMLLAKHRGRSLSYKPLTVQDVLKWADEHHARTGEWPTYRSGVVHGVKDETWRGIAQSLRRGARGLPHASALFRLLLKHRGVKRRGGRMRVRDKSPLSYDQIAAWARAHHRRSGRWPEKGSGSVAGAPGETWHGVWAAVTNGWRGLPGKTTLDRFLRPQDITRRRKARP